MTPRLLALCALLAAPALPARADALPVPAAEAAGTAAPAEPARPPTDAEVAAAAAQGLTPAMIEKLSAAQITEVLMAREEAKVDVEREQHNDKAPIAIAVPLAFFLCIFAIVAGALYYRFRKDRHLHETLRAMIEKGVDIPAALLVPQRSPTSDLRRGILLAATGTGLAMFLAVLPDADPGVWAVGLVPLLIGAGYLVAWYLESSRR